MANPETSSRTRRWLFFVGIVAAGIGLYVLFRPYSSLSLLVILIGAGLIVTGISRVVGAEDNSSGGAKVVGALWIALGVAVLIWPDLTVRTLVWVLGGWLIVDGVIDVISGFRRSTDQRLASLLKGAASVIFGVLALFWPDITIIVIALLFAVKLVLFGISQFIAGFRGEPKRAAEVSPGPVRRWAHVGGAALALLIAVGLAAISSQWRNGEPVVDDFYTAPADAPAEPGALLAVEPFDNGIPEGADGYRILYSTTRDEGMSAVASAIVILPADASGPLPVIAWAHGTTGVDETWPLRSWSLDSPRGHSSLRTL